MRLIEVGGNLGRFCVLRSPIFLVSLALLLANDLYFKAAYPGWLTGKLSDFSGLLVFSLFLFPLHVGAAKVAAGVGLFFVWWKSPYSSLAIELVNDTGLITIGRVVDYSDLIALVVLPFSVHVYDNRPRRLANADLWQRLSLAPILVGTVLAVTGTSQRVITRPAEIRREESSAISEEEVDAIVESLLASRNDECRDRVDDRRGCVIDQVWFAYQVNYSGVRFEFQQVPSKRSIARVDRVIDSIKAAFAEKGEGFIYVEPLIDPEALAQ